MKKIGKTSALAVAAVLAVSGIAAAAAPASAATGPPSAACAAATAAYNQDQSAFKTLQDQLSSAENSPSILPDTGDQAIVAEHNELEGEEEDAIQVVDNAKDFAAEELAKLSQSDPIGENGHLDPTVYLELGAILGRVTSADIALAYVESQLSALNDQYEDAVSALNRYNEQLDALNEALSSLKGRVAAAQAAAQAAQEAEASACQGMTTPAATPTPAASGSGQYYDNGVTFAEGVYTDGESQYGVPVGGSVTPQYACTTVESNQGTPANGDSGDVFPQDGTDPEDIGTTTADQAEWLSGCVAGATADLNGTQSQAPTGSPSPTASPSTGSPATMPSAAPSGTGSTQQYYQNGAAFAKDNEGTLAASTEGAVTDAGVSACSAVASSSPGAGMAGGEDTDTGSTAADQAAWISGCAANYTGTGTSTTDPA